MPDLNRLLQTLQDDIRAINWRTAAYIVLNVTSSIGIVLSNKVVYKSYGFNFATLLTLFHFVCTFLGLLIAAKLKVFSPVVIDWKKIVPLSLSFCGFVVFTNLSLRFNTVGFYQIFKVMTTPVIVVIEFFVYNKTKDTNTLASLTVVVVGVVFATVNDVTANFWGTVYAVLGVIVTSFYQIWVGTKQKELEVNSTQLLLYQAPISAIMLIPMIPIFDPIGQLATYEVTIGALVMIVITGVLAFSVNLSIFLLIGNSSPITYNVVGHFKLSFLILSGVLFFGDVVSFKVVVGVVLTLVGIFWYTHIKLQVQKIDRQAKMEQEDDTPLVEVRSLTNK